MTVVSYDSGKMKSAIRAYKGVLGNIESIRSTMTTEVNKIKSHWEGDDAQAAEPDLNAIISQMEGIEKNLNQIITMFTEVDAHFNELDY